MAVAIGGMAVVRMKEKLTDSIPVGTLLAADNDGFFIKHTGTAYCVGFFVQQQTPYTATMLLCPHRYHTCTTSSATVTADTVSRLVTASGPDGSPTLPVKTKSRPTTPTLQEAALIKLNKALGTNSKDISREDVINATGFNGNITDTIMKTFREALNNTKRAKIYKAEAYLNTFKRELAVHKLNNAFGSKDSKDITEQDLRDVLVSVNRNFSTVDMNTFRQAVLESPSDTNYSVKTWQDFIKNTV